MLTAALATAAVLLTSVQDVFPRGDTHSELRRVHPMTLAPSGKTVRLAGFLQGGWARSPGSSRLALGVSSRGRVQIVPGRAVQTGQRTVWWLLGWPQERRVVALGYGDADGAPVVVLDPIAGRMLRSARVSGNVVAGVTTADGLALLVAPPGRIADAELALLDAGGNERRYPLPGVPAGFVPPDADGNARSITPGLAVRDGVAYIATDTRVLEVDLTSGARIAHPLGTTARAAKGSDGNLRSIVFVGPHQLALSGEDHAGETVRWIGLRVVDTRTWAVRRVAGGARGAVPLPGGGLAAWPTNRGLALLDANGQPRRTVLRGRRLVQVQAAGRYAYAVAHEPRHRTYVVDLRSGRVVRTLPTARPGRLLS